MEGDGFLHTHNSGWCHQKMRLDTEQQNLTNVHHSLSLPVFCPYLTLCNSERFPTEDSSWKVSQRVFLTKDNHQKFPQKVYPRSFPSKDFPRGFPQKLPLEDLPQKISPEGSPQRFSQMVLLKDLPRRFPTKGSSQEVTWWRLLL